MMYWVLSAVVAAAPPDVAVFVTSWPTPPASILVSEPNALSGGVASRLQRAGLRTTTGTAGPEAMEERLIQMLRSGSDFGLALRQHGSGCVSITAPRAVPPPVQPRPGSPIQPVDASTFVRQSMRHQIANTARAVADGLSKAPGFCSKVAEPNDEAAAYLLEESLVPVLILTVPASANEAVWTQSVIDELLKVDGRRTMR